MKIKNNKMKRIIKYFWDKFRSSFKHRIGEITHNPTTTQYYNVWTNKTWIE